MKALPHLGEEEHVEALGMAERLGLALAGDHYAAEQEQGKDAERDDNRPIALIPIGNRFESHAQFLPNCQLAHAALMGRRT